MNLATLDPSAGLKLVTPLLLALPRIGAIFATTPLLAQHGLSSMTRNTVVLSMSLAVYPYMASMAPQAGFTFLQWIAFTGKELLVGALIGYAVGMLVWMLESVGGVVDVQSGLANVTLFNPFGGQESSVFGTLMSVLGMVMFIGLGGLYVLLSMLFDSYRLWPPTDLLPTLGHPLAQHGIDATARVTDGAIRLALPIILVLCAIDLGLGMIGRFTPQLNVFFFAGPIKSAVAALMLALSLSYLLDYGRGFLSTMQDDGAAEVGAALRPR